MIHTIRVHSLASLGPRSTRVHPLHLPFGSIEQAPWVLGLLDCVAQDKDGRRKARHYKLVVLWNQGHVE